MKPGLLKPVALATSISILVAGCANLTPGENAGVFGATAGLMAGGIARAAGMSGAESFAIGAATGAVVAITAYIIAKHQATERQRQVAIQRARVYQSRIVAERKRERAEASGTKVAGKKGGKVTAKKTAPKKRPRYIAVDTEKNEKTSPKAKKAVMIWDTQSETIVGNNVYDVQNPPAVGSTAKFETYSAGYVGGGS